jgi:hypothetical protein
MHCSDILFSAPKQTNRGTILILVSNRLTTRTKENPRLQGFRHKEITIECTKEDYSIIFDSVKSARDTFQIDFEEKQKTRLPPTSNSETNRSNPFDSLSKLDDTQEIDTIQEDANDSAIESSEDDDEKATKGSKRKSGDDLSVSSSKKQKRKGKKKDSFNSNSNFKN